MTIAEYGQLDGLAMADLVRRRAIAPAELVATAIERIERMEGGPSPLGAVVTRAFEQARAAAATIIADGPFCGVPFLLKDVGPPWAGVRLTMGSRFLRDHVPARDGVLLGRHRAAGLIPLGRTAVPELALVPFTEPRAYAPVATPWAEGRTAGGSSGGSAAAVAAGLVPLAHGSDGGGSLRIPGSCCGLFALKPSRGRTPFGPDASDAWFGLVEDHALTRSVRDSAALLDATCAPAPGVLYHAPAPHGGFLAALEQPPAPLRVALTTTPFFPATVHPDCAAAARDSASLLASCGHTVEEIELDIDAHAFLHDFFTLVCADVAAQITAASTLLRRRPRRAELETATWIMATRGAQISAPALVLARQRMLGLARQMGAIFERFDVLVTPTLAQPPVPFGALLPRGFDAVMQEVIVRLHLGVLLRVPGVPALLEQNAATVLGFMPYTPLANVTGQPSMSVPLHWNPDGLPIGTMFTGRYGDDVTLFRLAAELERARPWSQRRPPRHADRHA